MLSFRQMNNFVFDIDPPPDRIYQMIFVNNSKDRASGMGYAYLESILYIVFFLNLIGLLSKSGLLFLLSGLSDVHKSFILG